MDYDEYNSYSGSLRPVDPVVKDRGTRSVRRKAEEYDRGLKQWDAWQTQKKAQRWRRWTDEQRLQAIENAVSAADLEIAARGIPFILRLERMADKLVIVLSNEFEGTEHGIARRDDPLAPADVDPNTIGLHISDFLKKHGIILKE